MILELGWLFKESDNLRLCQSRLARSSTIVTRHYEVGEYTSYIIIEIEYMTIVQLIVYILRSIVYRLQYTSA